MPETLGPYELRSRTWSRTRGCGLAGLGPGAGAGSGHQGTLLPEGADPATAAEYAAHFLREGQAAARLSHPGIVGIYAADMYQDRLALVMELVEGETLGQLISRGPVDPSTALSILEQLLDALSFAHSQGVIHGDIRPDTIFLTSGGQVKLAGFGIPHLGGDPALARAGLVTGTPGYMAPEQVSGIRWTPERTSSQWGRWPTRCSPARTPSEPPTVCRPMPSCTAPCTRLPLRFPRRLWPICREIFGRSLMSPWPRTRMTASPTPEAS